MDCSESVAEGSEGSKKPWECCRLCPCAGGAALDGSSLENFLAVAGLEKLLIEVELAFGLGEGNP